jgi:hypothetical protein
MNVLTMCLPCILLAPPGVEQVINWDRLQQVFSKRRLLAYADDSQVLCAAFLAEH